MVIMKNSILCHAAINDEFDGPVVTFEDIYKH